MSATNISIDQNSFIEWIERNASNQNVARGASSSVSAKAALFKLNDIENKLADGQQSLSAILQKISVDLGDVNNGLMVANRSLGDANARLRANQTHLGGLTQVMEVNPTLAATAEAQNDQKKFAKKIADDQANVATYNAKITQLNAKKWSLSVLANRVLQSLNKLNIARTDNNATKSKLTDFVSNSGFGYVAVYIKADWVGKTLEDFYRGMNTLDAESNLNTFNSSMLNIIAGKNRDGSSADEFGIAVATALPAFNARKAEEAKDRTDFSTKIALENEAAKKRGEEMYAAKVAHENTSNVTWGILGALGLGFAAAGPGTVGAGATSAAATGTVTTTSSGLLVADAGVVGGGSLAGSGTATTLAELGIGAGTSTAGTGGLTIAGAGTVGAGSSTALSTAGTATTLTELGISGTATTSVSTAAATATASELSAATSAYQTALSRLSAASEYLQAVKATPGVTQSAIANAQALVNNLKPGLQSAFEVLTKLTH